MPPADADRTRSLPSEAWAHIPAGTVWHRIHGAQFGPEYYNTSDHYRFNAPNGEFGVLYVAEHPAGAFAESCFRSCLSFPPMVTRGQLATKARSELSWEDDLRVVDLSGPGCLMLGLDSRLTGGSDYRIAQAWSRWLWLQPEAPQGILYRSRYDADQRCLALFSDRMKAAQVRTRASRLTAHAFEAELGQLLKRYHADYL